jgi:RsiW-degrading membrane proteinase PrsW (M82 family)
VLVIAGGHLLSRGESINLLLAPLTILGIAIPIWWMIEFARRKLPRSTGLREWGSLTVGLSAAPLIIIIIETVMVILIGILLIFALSTQPGVMQDLTAIFKDFDLTQNDLESLEELLLQLARNPLLASAILLVVGFLAPLIEEVFKPMVIWPLLNHPIKQHEGFSLGLISGGTFALLESTRLVNQISPSDWVAAIALRTATGLLHIGLSGFVGFGFAKYWPEKRYGNAFIHLLIATGLHGVWNALALINGYSTSIIPVSQQTNFPAITSVLAIGFMVAVFCIVILLTLRINRRLRLELRVEAASETIPDSQERGY